MNTTLKAIVMGTGILTLSAMSHAALLPNFPYQQAPDISSQFVTVTYNSTTHVFSATGQTAQLENPDNVTTNVTGTRIFSLSLEVNPATGVPVDNTGTLSITGYVGATPTGTLLTGTLTAGQFGFVDAGGDEFDFYFTVTGGDLSSTIPGYAVGHQIAVRLDANFPVDAGTVPNFNGSFLSAFDNAPGTSSFSLIGTADTYAVPEPASMALLSLGGLLFVRRRTRR